jgi:hypothetical protein
MSQEEDQFEDESGWRVSFQFGSIAPRAAWKVFHAMLKKVEEKGEEGDSAVRQHSFSLMVSAHSFTWGKVEHEYRHCEYPSGGKDWALMFITLEGRKVSLVAGTAFYVR